MSLPHRRTFASDNWSGVYPDIFAAIAEANTLHAPAYGGDYYAELLKKLMIQELSFMEPSQCKASRSSACSRRC